MLLLAVASPVSGKLRFRAYLREVLLVNPDVILDDCVFCSRRDQPEVLFETSTLYAMPDKYPMLPGHTLIIAQQHLSCYAAATDALLDELEIVASRIRRFLEAAYNSPVLIFENGIAGQTVFHAHLHLVPVRISDLPAAVTQHGDIVPATDWDEVRQYHVVNGTYRYVQLCESRYIVVGYSPVLHTMRRVMAETTGLAWSENGWIKATTPDDVTDLSRRWREWTAVSDPVDG